MIKILMKVETVLGNLKTSKDGEKKFFLLLFDLKSVFFQHQFHFGIVTVVFLLKFRPNLTTKLVCRSKIDVFKILENIN